MGAKFTSRRWAVLLGAVTGLVALACLVLFHLFFDRPHTIIPVEFDISVFRQLPASDKCFQVNFDFESESGPNIRTVVREDQKKSTKVFAFPDSLEYGPTFSSKIKSICETSRFWKLSFACDVFAQRKDLPVPVVVSIELDGKSLYWKSINIPFAESQWKNVGMEFILPTDSVDPEAELKVYIWNNSRHTFMIDNMQVGFISGGGDVQTYGFYPERHVSYDFESNVDQNVTNVDYNGPSKSGRGSCKLDMLNPFSPIITRRIGMVADGPMKDITVRAEVYPSFKNPSLYFAVSLSDSSGKEYFFKSRSDHRKYNAGSWNPMKANMDLPAEQIRPNDIISVYVWNKGFQRVYIDDFEVQFAESNKRVGVKPIVDMYGYGEGGYDFKANVPPFRTRLLSAFQLTGVNAPSEPAADDFKKSVLNAFDKISVGRFGAFGSNQSQLAVVRNQKLYFLGLCNGESKWRQLAQISVSNVQGLDLTNSNWLVKDINEDGKEELIVHKKGANYLHLLNPETGAENNPCSNNNSQGISAAKISLDAVINASNYNLIACDDFIGTGVPEFLFADFSNGKFLILEASGNLLAKGYHPSFKSNNPLELLVKPVQLFSVKGKKQLAIRSNESSGFNYFVFTDDGGDLVEQKLTGSDLINFIGCDAVMDASTSNDSNLLFHRTVPKYGLFAVSCDAINGFVIQNEFDFSGYPNQRNPKYYEKRVLFLGDFTGLGKRELLIISSNCGDPKFNGYSCSTPDFSTPFPPVTYIFTLD